MSALTIFQNFPTTKAEIATGVQNAKEIILSGDFNPLEIDLHLKKVEEFVKALREDNEVKQAVLSELEKYTEKTVKFSGCEITKKGMTTWNYDLCGDTELILMEDKAKALAEQIKARKTVLQNITDEGMITPDGELIYRAEKQVKDTFAIKIL